MITAKILADSKSTLTGHRITTMIVTFPRYILAEFNTHRMFSRNSASSRAIPFEKMVKSVQENPFIPMGWQKDHKGMQGTEYITDVQKLEEIKGMWLVARDNAVSTAKYLSTSDLNVTKQIINRLLEPFMWHTVIVTATEYENFFALRCPQYQIFNNATPHYFRSKKDCIKFAPDLLNEGHYAKPFTPENSEWFLINKGQADIHMMALAEAMYDAYNESTPKNLEPGEWHIPFGDKIEEGLLKLAEPSDVTDETVKQMKLKIAVARCARVSYTVIGEEDKPHDYEADLRLHDRLASSGHWSPFEHIAQAMYHDDYLDYLGGNNGTSGNLIGFNQYRKFFSNENITTKNK